ncbi:MAG: SpoIIE family protein phosphatase [Colwelliaceae bacterium]|nr:SpoIIE family protein phosphatase [Colwelliaceae bacterium]
MKTLVDGGNSKLALVVDDSPMQCKVLSILLKEEGYRVFTANDGARAVAIYIKFKPDLVLMDINMPIMNGYEAARKIKSLSNKNSLCPLIFITSMDTDQAFIESIEAGGDGILVRPFSPEVFKAKIKSIQRISDLYGTIKELQQEQQKDAELAEQLMADVIESRNYGLDRIGIVKKPATLFSGDIQLTALSPNGDINALLGDFTGHGLRSSIGAIPLSETFRAMTKKGFSIFEIITEINQQLYDLLPTDLFLAAGFVSLSSHDKSAYIFNAGLPDTYIFDSTGKIKHKVESSHPPLGVLPNLLPEVPLSVINIMPTDRIVLLSDGIVEARNEEGDMYDIERFEQAAILGVIKNNVSQSVLKNVIEFCQGIPQEDDISLIDIPCGGWQQLYSSNKKNNEESIESLSTVDVPSSSAWHWKLSLSGSRLASVNPIPMAMNQIHEIEGSGEHWQSVFTILTELYVNALDHGVLELSSDYKNSPEGFTDYYKEREKRLKDLTSGFIDISLAYFPIKSGGKLEVKIKDSGKGFDFTKLNKNIDSTKGSNIELSGRGINLVEQICEHMSFSEAGTLIEASYIWTN